MTEWTLSSHHSTTYGRAQTKADPAKCAHSVWKPGGFSGRTTQCTRARGHGPEQAFCKQHSPEAKQQRAAESQARWRSEQKMRARFAREAAVGSKALDACRQIAAGHNDPRGLAQSVIDMLEEGK